MKKFLGFLVMALLIFAVLWLIFNPSASSNNPQNNQQNQNDNIPDGENVGEENPAQDIWFGELKASDDPAKGNLMLILSDGSEKTVYITTSRDYSALFDQEVVATVEGTTAGFRLIDIQLDTRGDIHLD